MPQPIRRSAMVPRIRPGDISPQQAAREEWQGQTSEWISPAASARLLWALEAQTFKIVPTSHRSGVCVCVCVCVCACSVWVCAHARERVRVRA